MASFLSMSDPRFGYYFPHTGPYIPCKICELSSGISPQTAEVYLGY